MSIKCVHFGCYSLVWRFYWHSSGPRSSSFGFKETANQEYENKSNGELFKTTLPAIFLLFAVIFGPLINDLIGFVLFTPLVIWWSRWRWFLFVPTFRWINRWRRWWRIHVFWPACSVGIFLAFINVIAETGTFAVIAGAAQNAPAAIVVPVAILTGVLIGIPAGAYVLRFNTSATSCRFIRLPSLSSWLCNDGVGLGSQMSFVNIMKLYLLVSKFRFWM